MTLPRRLPAPFFLTAFFALATLAACTPDRAPPETTAAEAPASGLDLGGMDSDVRPQDDLFAYANGNWLRETTIPADKPSWGTFEILRERTIDQLKIIVAAAEENPDSHNARIIANLYRDLLAANQQPRADLGVFADEFAAIDAIASHTDLPALFARMARLGATTPIGAWVDQDRKDSRRYAVYLTQGGLGLPDRDYYFDDSEQGQALRAGYLHYLQRLLALADDGDNAGDRSAAVMALETSLAEHHWTRVANRDAEKTYNATPGTALLDTLGSDWQAFFTGFDIVGQDQYVVRQPSYVAALTELVAAADLTVWRDYLKLQLLDAYAPYLGAEFDQAQFSFYGKLLNGTPEQEPQWQRAINFMNGSVGEVLGQLYVDRHFPPEDKAHMEQLVANLKRAFHDSISDLPWMTPATRERALAKLASFNTKIGYPDKWRDYSALDIEADDLIGNIQRIRLWHHQRDVERLGQPVDRDEWFMPPQTVNAYYSPSMNEIVFPAAILQPPFFNRDADDAINYGAIGAVIGHEIGHGFDDQGSRYDGEGNLNNWWSEEDREHFDALGKKLATQYSQYQPLPGEFTNGELTLGENIGDLGGLSMALRAYQLSLNGEEPPVLDGYTGYQRVFLGWAQGWRVKRRDELVRQLLKT
ncbi:MAG: M13 family metallopeptidase, partial [Porticoccaceae bacterium]